jgi:hypothetical protein
MKRVVVVVSKCRVRAGSEHTTEFHCYSHKHSMAETSSIAPTPAPQNLALIPAPRAVFSFNSITAELWCNSDLLMQTTAARQSSTEIRQSSFPKSLAMPVPQIWS